MNVEYSAVFSRLPTPSGRWPGEPPKHRAVYPWVLVGVRREDDGRSGYAYIHCAGPPPQFLQEKRRWTADTLARILIVSLGGWCWVPRVWGHPLSRNAPLLKWSRTLYTITALISLAGLLEVANFLGLQFLPHPVQLLGGARHNERAALDASLQRFG